MEIITKDGLVCPRLTIALDGRVTLKVMLTNTKEEVEAYKEWAGAIIKNLVDSGSMSSVGGTMRGRFNRDDSISMCVKTEGYTHVKFVFDRDGKIINSD